MSKTLTMPRPVPAPFRLVAGSRPAHAPLPLLGWLTFPAHFVLGLMLLRPCFMSHKGLPWVMGALLTALLAVRPLQVGITRRSRWRLLASTLGMAYANTLGCAALTGHGPDVVAAATVLGIPFAAVYCVPFYLLSFPLLGAALRLAGSPAFDDVDECLQLVGLHALGAAVLVLLVQGVFDGEFLRTTTGQVATALLALGGILLAVVTARRMSGRRRFVQSVERGEVPGYAVVRLGDVPTPPALSREVRARHACTESLVLVQVVAAYSDGAYRSHHRHVPVARV